MSTIAPARAAATPTSGVAPPRILGIFSPRGLAMTVAIAIAFVAFFVRWFLRQHEFSAKHLEDWGHAYFIPGISLYMLWMRRQELAAAKVAVFWPGLPVFLVGMVCYVFFIVGVSNHMLQGFALILSLFGVTLLLAGPAVMRVVFLPIAFLAFGVTISESWMIKLTFPLQLIASQGAWVLLTILGPLFGYSVDVVGNLLTIAASGGEPHPLDVAEACSGLRMVVAFFALAGAVALMSTSAWWQRVTLLTLALPIALVINVVRVTVLGLATLVDPNLVAGEAHTLIGTILLIPGLMLFMFVRWSLARLVREGP